MEHSGKQLQRVTQSHNNFQVHEVWVLHMHCVLEFQLLRFVKIIEIGRPLVLRTTRCAVYVVGNSSVRLAEISAHRRAAKVASRAYARVPVRLCVNLELAPSNLQTRGQVFAGDRKEISC